MANDELAVVVNAGAPMEMFTGPQMADMITRYKGLQDALDRSMPDQIMSIGERRFRKKGYWRAIAVAFKLTVEPTDERREVQGQFHDGSDNFGYILTYRATAPNGRATTGDGSAFAIEKAARFKCKHPHPSWAGKTAHFPATICPDYDPDHSWASRPPEATEHNVRSHAHTRAFNRAVSNLVGFGEVSAEEAGDYTPRRSPATGPSSDRTQDRPEPAEYDDEYQAPPADGPTISEAQGKRLWAISKSKGWSEAGLRGYLTGLGYQRSAEIPRRVYDQVIQHLETQPPQ